MASKNIVPRADADGGGIGTTAKRWTTVKGQQLIGGAGTTAVAPLTLLSGTNLTTAAAGAFEYDGTALYGTAAALNRGYIPITNFTSNVADFTMVGGATAQSPFEAARDVLTLAGSTTYEIDWLFYITGMGGTTRTSAIKFTGSGATFTAFNVIVECWTGVAGAVNTVYSQVQDLTCDGTVVANATVTTAAMTMRVKGLVRVNAGGTFIPQLKFSADPTGTILCKAGSYCKMTPIGTNTVGSVGNWA